MKIEHKVDLIIGLAFLLMGSILNLPAAVGVGIALTLSGVYRHIKFADIPEHDERTKKLSCPAFAFTLLIILLTLFILMLIDKFKILNLTVSQVLSLISIILILNLVISLWYFRRRSDVE